MPDPALVILYVSDPTASAGFYRDLLGHEPVETSPTFAMLPLRPGLMLGLWAATGVEPPASAGGGSGEIAFTVAGPDAVEALHADWKGRGVRIAQAPAVMDFGTTFTALDPDGHRLRVLAAAAG